MILVTSMLPLCFVLLLAGNALTALQLRPQHPVNYSVSVLVPVDDIQGSEKTLNGADIQADAKDAIQFVELRAQRGPCNCEEGVCTCCTGYLMQFFAQKGCVNLAYEPDDFAISVQVSMNDRTVYKNSVSGKNPRPVCVPIPRFTSLKMCVRFSNVFLVGPNVHTCVDIDGMFRENSLFRMSLDCVRLGANGVALLKPEDGGGLPPDETDYPDSPDEGSDYDVPGIGSAENISDNGTVIVVSSSTSRTPRSSINP